MANRYVAGASGLPFAVLRGYRGTGLARAAKTRSAKTGAASTHASIAEDPRARSPVRSSPRWRPWRPDVTVIHAQRADRGGQRAVLGITGVQKEAVLAAAAVGRHRRGDRRCAGSRGPVPSCCRPGRSATWRWLREARIRPMRLTTRSATTTSTSPGTRSVATARLSGSGSRGTSSRSRIVTGTAPTGTAPTGTAPTAGTGTGSTGTGGTGVGYSADEIMTVTAAPGARCGRPRWGRPMPTKQVIRSWSARAAVTVMISSAE